MSQERIDTLKKARSALADIRFAWAEAVAKKSDRTATEQQIKHLIEVQQAIDAVDWAIEDEDETK